MKEEMKEISEKGRKGGRRKGGRRRKGRKKEGEVRLEGVREK